MLTFVNTCSEKMSADSTPVANRLSQTGTDWTPNSSANCSQKLQQFLVNKSYVLPDHSTFNLFSKAATSFGVFSVRPRLID